MKYHPTSNPNNRLKHIFLSLKSSLSLSLSLCLREYIRHMQQQYREMPPSTYHRTIFYLTLCLIVTLSACGGDSSSKEYDYICSNGTPAEGQTSTQDTQKCASCETGYTLSSGESCVADSGGTAGSGGYSG